MKPVKFWKVKAKVTSVVSFPLGGAIAYFTCSCGITGGRPIHGKPEDFQYMVGKGYTHSCPSRAHEKMVK